jgi:hypothetical protein
MFVRTFTPFTETDTVPPFQPSPNVSVNLIVCVHCENMYVLNNININDKKFLIVKKYFNNLMTLLKNSN